MGKPKFSRKKYETPSHPWKEDRIKEENELITKYGLKNKKEVWKAKTRLRQYRQQARGLLAKVVTGDLQSKKEADQLILHLNRMNILPANSTLDDILALDIEAILSRRLETLTYLKGLANTPDQARQLISHGHVSVNNKKVTIPGYMVTKDEEVSISYTNSSPLNDTMHPARPRGEFSDVPKRKEEKPKKEEALTTEAPKTESPKETSADKQPTTEPKTIPLEEKPTIEEPPGEEQPPAELPQKEEKTEEKAITKPETNIEETPKQEKESSEPKLEGKNQKKKKKEGDK